MKCSKSQWVWKLLFHFRIPVKSFHPNLNNVVIFQQGICPKIDQTSIDLHLVGSGQSLQLHHVIFLLYPGVESRNLFSVQNDCTTWVSKMKIKEQGFKSLLGKYVCNIPSNTWIVLNRKRVSTIWRVQISQNVFINSLVMENCVNWILILDVIC